MPKLADQILKVLSGPDAKPLSPANVGKRLKLKKKQFTKFQDTVQQLIDDGRLKLTRRGKLRIAKSGSPETPAGIAGVFQRISSGAGFVIPHEESPQLKGDVYIPPADVGDAHTGDEVLIQLSSRRQRGRQCGKIISVLERATNKFVGTYFEEAGQGYVSVDGGTFRDPIAVGDPGAKGAQPEDKVVIEMLRFPSPVLPGEAVLTEVLGPRGTPGVDVLAVIHEFGLPVDFEEETLDEARAQADAFEESNLQGREDLTKELTVTIDPVDARDFDDAISLKKLRNGHWELKVHIADVAAFVLPGSPLDKEAQHRGTSVYLPSRVIPMLPELLSNGLASLQKGRVRFTKTVTMEYTPDGAHVHSSFLNSAIKVNRRFAYEEILPILNRPEDHKGKVSAKIRQMLGWMHELAMTLRRRRFQSGSLELDLGEVKIDFDKEGQVIGAHEAVHDESHQMIEEFMLAANIAVAQELTDRGIPFIRRGHAPPDFKKLKNFSQFAAALGYPIQKFESKGDLQKLLKRISGKPPERAINYALLRSMKQAVYTEAVEGHYALGEENYCHFTSPIRRYPDLVVHRILDDVVISKSRKKSKNITELAKLSRHCSNTERRAASAERELTKVKLLTYMESRIGDELTAVITGVERFGIFCQGTEVPAEGLVHVTALEPADRYEFDQATYAFIGRRTGTRYQLGDRIQVMVARVDIDRRELDFRIAPKKATKKKRSKSRRKKRR